MLESFSRTVDRATTRFERGGGRGWLNRPLKPLALGAFLPYHIFLLEWPDDRQAP